jgi:hypothetical protein
LSSFIIVVVVVLVVHARSAHAYALTSRLLTFTGVSDNPTPTTTPATLPQHNHPCNHNGGGKHSDIVDYYVSCGSNGAPTGASDDSSRMEQWKAVRRIRSVDPPQ